MTAFTPKTYQSQVLESLTAYFQACHELPSPSIAFTAATERLWGRGNPYNPLSGFPAGMPRVPTGGVMELTATPDLERTPSNVLHSVSAAELKAEEMIKLPVVLETEPNWRQCLADAIGRRDALHKLADEDRRAGADYLRPLVLIQSEPRRAGVETLDFEKVRNELTTNHGIPANEIAVATGEEKGLEKIEADFKRGIANPACPVKFVITQKALAEGWDCPFAYILVSMASLHSATAVEQLLARVLW